MYLADVKWEVRDSALEVLITCMKLAKESEYLLLLIIHSVACIYRLLQEKSHSQI